MSTSANGVKKSKLKGLLALATSFFVAVGGLAIAPAAVAAERVIVTTTVSNVVAEESITVAVSASGLPGDIHASLAPQGGTAPGQNNAVMVADAVVTDGSASFTITVPIAKLQDRAAYEVMLWKKQSSASNPENVYARTPVQINEAQWNELFPVVEPPAEEPPAEEPPAEEPPVEEPPSENTDEPAPAEPEGNTATEPDTGDDAGSSENAGSEESAPALPGASEVTGTDGADFIWAFKESWNSYVTNQWVGGYFTVSNGAMLGENGVIGFVADSNDYDAESGEGTIKYTGQVRYISEAHGFDITMANPWVVFDGETATVTAELSEVAAIGSEATSRVAVAVLDAPEYADADSVRTWAAQPATLANLTQPKGGWERYAGQAAAPVTFSVEVVEKLSEPRVEVVDSVTDLDPNAETVVTVKGSGFFPSDPATTGTRPPFVGKFTGAYVVFGSFAEWWKPSEGVASSERSVIDQKWAVPAENVGMLGAAGVVLNEDGTFEAQLTISKNEAKALDEGRYGIYTYPGGGATYAPFETYTPVTFAEPRVEVVESVTDLDPDAETVVTVKGSGFLPNAPHTSGTRPPFAGQFTGTYVVFGSFAEDWEPSEGVAATERSVIQQKWAVPAASVGMLGAAGIVLNEDGTFEAQLTISKDEEKALADGRYGIYTYPGGGAKYAPFETYTPVTFAVDAGEEAPTPTEPTPAPEAGTMLWGFKDTYVNYVINAGGKISVTKPATQKGNVFEFQQLKGGSWDVSKQTGSVRFAGAVNFYAHNGGMNITFSNPIITVSDAKTAVLSMTRDGKAYKVADIDLSQAKTTVGKNGAVTWSNAATKLRSEGVEAFGDFYDAGTALSPITFTAGSASVTEPVVPPVTKPAVKPAPATPSLPVFVPPSTSKSAGSLTWGVSSQFETYVKGQVAKGGVTTSGVGGGTGGYVFPQANGGSWNPVTQTGSVHYSGVVTFSGHHGQLNVPVSNPVITVHNGSSATLTASGRTFSLNLAAASKHTGANGEITWRGVPVTGGFSFGSYDLGADALTFTVGAANNASFGSSSSGAPTTEREIPDTAPSVEGIEILTAPDKIRPGGMIELQGSGFQTGEYGIAVVLYSEPTVLDSEAMADDAGTVRWIGKLPEDIEPGTHTITLQGSIAIGAEIEVLEATADEVTLEIQTDQAEVAEAGIIPLAVSDDAQGSGVGTTAVWVGALALLVIAGAAAVLVVNKRRQEV